MYCCAIVSSARKHCRFLTLQHSKYNLILSVCDEHTKNHVIPSIRILFCEFGCSLSENYHTFSYSDFFFNLLLIFSVCVCVIHRDRFHSHNIPNGLPPYTCIFSLPFSLSHSLQILPSTLCSHPFARLVKLLVFSCCISVYVHQFIFFYFYLTLSISFSLILGVIGERDYLYTLETLNVWVFHFVLCATLSGL